MAAFPPLELGSPRFSRGVSGTAPVLTARRALEPLRKNSVAVHLPGEG